MRSTTADAAQTLSLAATLFGTAGVTSQDLDTLLCMPWQDWPPTTSTPTPPAAQSHPAQSQAKTSALLLQAAAPLLGLPELTSSDLSSKQGSASLIHKALQDSDAAVQAAATVLLPVILANTAEAAKGKGQATVGVRLLQKGLDCLSGVLNPQGGPPSGPLQLALAHALGGFVSMQAVVEHRAVALCQASTALLELHQSGSATSKNDTGKGGRSSGDLASGPSGTGGLSGLHCWPVLKQRVQELGVTGHGGAAVPVKAVRSFADALLSPEQDGLRGLGKVLHVADAQGGPDGGEE